MIAMLMGLTGLEIFCLLFPLRFFYITYMTHIPTHNDTRRIAPECIESGYLFY